MSPVERSLAERLAALEAAGTGRDREIRDLKGVVAHVRTTVDHIDEKLDGLIELKTEATGMYKLAKMLLGAGVLGAVAAVFVGLIHWVKGA